MGIPVTLTNYEMRHAAMVGVTRHIASRATGKANLRGLNAKDVAEVWFVDLIGAMGEMAFAKVAGLYWPGSVNVGKFEADIPPDFQVRTAREHSHCLIVREDDPPEFRYALVTGTGPEFIVQGYICGHEAKQRQFFEDRGGRGKPAYWIPQDQLTPANEELPKMAERRRLFD
jgi:hypothetical protein